MVWRFRLHIILGTAVLYITSRLYLVLFAVSSASLLACMSVQVNSLEAQCLGLAILHSVVGLLCMANIGCGCGLVVVAWRLSCVFFLETVTERRVI